METKTKDSPKSGGLVHSIHLPSIKISEKNKILLKDTVTSSPMRKKNPIMNKSFQNRQKNEPTS